MKKIDFIDSHAHLNLIVKKEFDTALTKEELIQANIILDSLQQANLKVINVGTSLIESLNCLEIAKLNPNIAKAAIGIHPNDITETWEQDLEKLEDILKDTQLNKLVVAIGECGYDKHYENYDIAKQEVCFKKQIELSLKYNKALIIHTRDARQETLKTLQEYSHLLKQVVVHCFSEDRDFAEQVTKWGFKMGIGGTVTYPKNQYLRDIVKEFGLKNIILETDAPYLSPQSLRGRPNSPLNIPLIADFLAELLEASIEEVASVTTGNCKDLFKLN